MNSDGLVLRDIARNEHFDPKRLWGDVPLLLIKAPGPTGDAPFLFQTPDADDSLLAETSVVSMQAIGNYVTQTSVVVPVAKTKRNPFDSICVGRARNNDIRLDHPTVSKVHVYLVPSKANSDLWKIQDASSTNGTWYLTGSGPMRLPPGEQMRLPVGTELRFGTVDCLFLDCESLSNAIMYAVAAWRLAEASNQSEVSGDTQRLLTDTQRMTTARLPRPELGDGSNSAKS